jgi:hypothetical protein
VSTPDFPEGFQGAGPMFAAVELGDPWYQMAALGADTYIPVTCEFGSDTGPPESAFLDRADAETVADAASGGVYEHWQGLSGAIVRTPAAQRETAGEPSQADREAAQRESNAEAWSESHYADYAEWLAGRQAEADPADEAERRAAYAAEWETEPEWDSADADRHEAGPEPEA